MRKILVATIHVNRFWVIVDGRLSMDVYILLMNLMFPDDLIKEVVMENTIVASDPDALKLEIELVNHVLKQPYPDFRKIKGLPWFIEGMRDNWDVLGQKVELRIYNTFEK